jgi:hypothetical protein
MLIEWSCFIHIGRRDCNCLDGFLNCSIDVKYILNYSIHCNIDYTQACTTLMKKLRHIQSTLIRMRYIAATKLQASSRILYLLNKFKAFKSIVLFMYHPELPACGVSRRKCTSSGIANIGIISVVPTPKRGLQR